MSFKVSFAVVLFMLALCSCGQNQVINDRYYLQMSDPGEYALMDSKGSNGLYPVWEIYVNNYEITGIVANIKEKDESFIGTCDIFSINIEDNIMSRKTFQIKNINEFRLFTKSRGMKRLHSYPLSCE